MQPAQVPALYKQAHKNGTKCNKNEPKRAKNSPKQPYFFSLSPVPLQSKQQKTKA